MKKFIPLEKAVAAANEKQAFRIRNFYKEDLIENLGEIDGIYIYGDEYLYRRIFDKFNHKLGSITSFKTIRGYFPAKIFNFPQIEHLFLWNQTYGKLEASCQIPDNFDRLPKLTTLKGIWVGKADGLQVDFPESLFLCQELKELVIGTNDSSMIPPKFHLFPNLEHLSLSIKNAMVKDFTAILESVAKCKQLKYFRLKLDKQKAGVFRLPLSFSQLKLTTLTLTGAILIPDGVSMDSLEYYKFKSPAYLKKLPWNAHSIPPKLHTLIIDGLAFLSSLEEIFKHTPKSLENLSLDRCGLTEIPLGIFDFPKLSSLNLRGNKIDKVPASFWVLPALKHVNLDYNRQNKGIKSKPLLKFANKMRLLGFSKNAQLLQMAVLIKDTAVISFLAEEKAVMLECLNSPNFKIAEEILFLYGKDKPNPFVDFDFEHSRTIVLGRIYGYTKNEIEEKLNKIKIQTTNDSTKATHVLLGTKPGEIHPFLLEKSLTLISKDAVKKLLRDTSDSYLSPNDKEFESHIANLNQLLYHNKANAELALSIMLGEGLPAIMEYEVFIWATSNFGYRTNLAFKILRKYSRHMLAEVAATLLANFDVKHLEVLAESEQAAILERYLKRKKSINGFFSFEPILNRAAKLGVNVTPYSNWRY